MTSGQGDIVVEVFRNDRNRNIFEGEVRVPIARIRDQYRHDEWYELYDARGQRMPGKLHLLMQWIHNKIEYYEGALAKWNEHITQHEEDLELYEHDLDVLYQPFPLIGSRERMHKMLVDKSMWQQPSVNISNNEHLIAQIPREPSGEHYTRIQNSYFFSATWFLLAMLISLERAVFIDVNFPLLSSLSLFFRLSSRHFTPPAISTLCSF